MLPNRVAHIMFSAFVADGALLFVLCLCSCSLREADLGGLYFLWACMQACMNACLHAGMHECMHASAPLLHGLLFSLYLVVGIHALLLLPCSESKQLAAALLC